MPPIFSPYLPYSYNPNNIQYLRFLQFPQQQQYGINYFLPNNPYNNNFNVILPQNNKNTTSSKTTTKYNPLPLPPSLVMSEINKWKPPPYNNNNNNDYNVLTMPQQYGND